MLVPIVSVLCVVLSLIAYMSLLPAVLDTGNKRQDPINLFQLSLLIGGASLCASYAALTKNLLWYLSTAPGAVLCCTKQCLSKLVSNDR